MRVIRSFPLYWQAHLFSVIDYRCNFGQGGAHIYLLPTLTIIDQMLIVTRNEWLAGRVFLYLSHDCISTKRGEPAHYRVIVRRACYCPLSLPRLASGVVGVE